MKKFLLVAVMFLSVVTLTQAQRGSGERPSQSGENKPKFDPEQMMQRQLTQLDEAVTLSDAQKVKVKEILQKSSEAREAQFESMKESGEQPDHEKMRAKMDELRKKETENIKAILTKDQLPKFDKYLAEREAKMKERMKGRMQNAPDGEDQ